MVLKIFKAFESAKNLVQKQIWSKIKEVKGNVGVKKMLIHRKCWSKKNNQEKFRKKYLNKKISYKTRLSYYNVTTRLVDLIGLCWLKQYLMEKYVRLGFIFLFRLSNMLN